MILTFRYRVKDGSKAVRRALRAQARAVNFVWNFCAETDRIAASRYRAGRHVKRPSAFDLANLCRGVTKELGIHSDTVDAVCAKFADSRRAYFPKTPRFRSAKRNLDWIPFSNFKRPARLDNDTLTFLSRSYPLWMSRSIPERGIPKSWNLSCNSEGHWFVNIQIELPDGERKDGPAVGIDLGLKTFATLSDGTKIEPPKFYRFAQEKLALYQRRKQKRQALRLAAKIARQRAHFLHVESTRIAKTYGFIAVGDASPSRLKKTKMAKSVSDAGWAMFRGMLQYKSIATGARCNIVNEKFSSQVCSECGSFPLSRPKGLEQLGIRAWVCSDCSTLHDRDVNASRNILRFGLEHQAPSAEILAL